MKDIPDDIVSADVLIIGAGGAGYNRDLAFQGDAVFKIVKIYHGYLLLQYEKC